MSKGWCVKRLVQRFVQKEIIILGKNRLGEEEQKKKYFIYVVAVSVLFSLFVVHVQAVFV